MCVPPPASTGEFAPPQPNPWSGFQDYGHSHWHDSLIVVDGVANVTVTGPGLLDGGPNMAENQPPAPGAATSTSFGDYFSRIPQLHPAPA